MLKDIVVLSMNLHGSMYFMPCFDELTIILSVCHIIFELLMHKKNWLQIRDSIRALFPDRECFTLVRPLNNENELQNLDQMSVSNFNGH